MQKLTVTLLILFLLPGWLRADDFGALLDSLDTVLASRPRVEAEHRARTDSIRASLAQISNPVDRYNILRSLYRSYRSYRIDSALIMADMRLECARQIGDPSRVISAGINLAESYAKFGDVRKAQAILDTLRPRQMEDYQRKYLNSVGMGVYRQLAETAALPAERVEAKARLRHMRDEAIAEAPEDSQGYYALQAERLLDAGQTREAVSRMEDAEARFDFSDNAIMQYLMGEIYLAAADTVKARDHIARAAIIDIGKGTKEYSSLILLSSILYSNGELDRAFKYINYALEDAVYSHAAVRTGEVMKIMPLIDASFHASDERARSRQNILMVVAAMFALLMLLVTVLLAMALRRNRRIMAQVEAANDLLQRSNDRLRETDSQKLMFINTLMLAYAGYIERLRDFRKSLYRKLKAGQYDKALNDVGSDRVESLELADFHAMFDRTFLALFPGFASKVSVYFTKSLEQKSPDRLSPELRVLALMRLGLTSTEEIARMLHYSPQTVYNYRSRIRNSLNCSREEFEKALARI